jgi:hypothetical protein
VLRRRVDETEAASGLDRRAFTRANQSAVASVGRGPLRRILDLIRAVWPRTLEHERTRSCLASRTPLVPSNFPTAPWGAGPISRRRSLA